MSDGIASEGNTQSVFEGLNVVDASEHPSGQWAGRLFAGMGAKVILLEPREGSDVRRIGPFYKDGADSAYFDILNRAKDSIALDFDTDAGAAIAKQLMFQADIILLGRKTIQFRNDIIRNGTGIVCRTSDFGEHGPYQHWHGSEMIHQALSGVMYVTGEESREPLYGCGHRSYYATGVMAFVAAAAALQEITPTTIAETRDIEITVAETCAAMGQNDVTEYNYNGSWGKRGHYLGLLGKVRCKDGWVVVFGYRNWGRICKAFGAETLANDSRFATVELLNENWEVALRLLNQAAKERSCADVVGLAQAGRASVEKVNSLDDILVSQQLRERLFIEGGGGEQREFRLGAPLRLSRSSVWHDRRAPRPGEHSSQILRSLEVDLMDIDNLISSGVVRRRNDEEIG